VSETIFKIRHPGFSGCSSGRFPSLSSTSLTILILGHNQPDGTLPRNKGVLIAACCDLQECLGLGHYFNSTRAGVTLFMSFAPTAEHRFSGRTVPGRCEPQFEH